MKKAYEDTIKKTNVCIVEVPEGKEKNRGLVVDSCQCKTKSIQYCKVKQKKKKKKDGTFKKRESLFRETVAESSPNLGREMDIQAHET